LPMLACPPIALDVAASSKRKAKRLSIVFPSWRPRLIPGS
jgi:hypothetical protein